jgi:glycosyltransferase involved in cell wall biosynthesis
MIRVAITAYVGDDAWLGGVNYYSSLVRALMAYPRPIDFEVKFLTNRPEIFGEPTRSGIELVDAPWLAPGGQPMHFLNAAIKTLGLVNPMLFHYLRHAAIDVVTHANACLFNPCPTLFWMPDFQHCHLPDHFSLYERTRRSRNVRMAARTGHILFSSYSAVRDFRHFFPEFPDTVAHVLQFVPWLGQTGPRPGEVESSMQRHTQAPYFFLPNQFWRHKNHQVVIEALHRLPDKVRVICTGALLDSRGQSHIDLMYRSMDEYGLAERFALLGVVSRPELFDLMHRALCVLNPSRFEGWSTTVEEAKYLGKRLILSDIPVHREQDPEDALFFKPNDPDGLAAAMLKVFEEYDSEQERKRALHGRERYLAGVARFAEQYWAIARDVAARGPLTVP